MDQIRIDFRIKEGKIKPLHGAHNSPVNSGSLVDVTPYYKEIGFPYIRLHDTNWPNPGEVDIHTIFKNFDADPGDPANYDFEHTDQYLKSILDTGAQIIYRLGTSIEHTPVKYHIHPPKDFNKWAEICLGIIRHYNEGWANGFRYNIRYWEIWNEPEGMPVTGSQDRLRLMWSGTNEQFLELYRTASTAIKREFPYVKVGGFACTMTDMEFLEHFLKACKDERLPLDFFSWHKYDISPESVAASILFVRAMLDKYGFEKTESHLNEWNYTRAPEGVTEFDQMFRAGNEYNTQEIFKRLKSEEGASYDAALLIKMQDLPVDIANYYDTATTSFFSLFNMYGVPEKNYYAFKAFSELYKHPSRIHSEVLSNETGLFCCAGLKSTGSNAAVLISNFSEEGRKCSISFENLEEEPEFICEIYSLDDRRNLELVDSQVCRRGELKITRDIGQYTVLLIKLKKV